MDYASFMIIHEFVSVEAMASSGCKVVMLCRDPRDIVNSFFHAMINDKITNPEDYLIQIIKGYVHRNTARENNALVWPGEKMISLL